MIPPTKVQFDSVDRDEILGLIRSSLDRGQLAQGENVEEFEHEFAHYVRTKHAIATSNGGAALEMVLRSLSVTCDSDLLVPSNTFIATASAVAMAGGRPVFVDMSERTLAPTIEQLEQAYTSRTLALILVHVGGLITPQIEEIRKWCDEHGIHLIEDCAHAHGSRYRQQSAGTWGIAGCYSFFATKVMTSAEGGMVVTNDDDLADELRVMRDYGKPERWVSYHTMLGANWRMNELEAAVGRVQLRRLDNMIEWRRRVAEAYDQLIFGNQVMDGDQRFDLDVDLDTPIRSGRSSWYKYVLTLPDGIDRDQVKRTMKAWNANAAGGVFEVPLHQQPVFMEDTSLPNTERFARQHLCLPIYYRMTAGEVRTVVRALYEAIREQISSQPSEERQEQSA